MSLRELVFWCVYLPLFSIGVYVVVLLIADYLIGIGCNV